MANNVQITAGSGTTIESIDEGGGVERQVIVLGSIGSAGSETQLTAGQKTSANSVPVVIASDQSSITVTGTVTANAGTNLNTSALAVETGGNLATLAGAVSAAKVQTTVATALPAGSNTIGKIDQGAGGASAWKVDGSAVTQPVSLASLPTLATGGNNIGGVYPAPTSSSTFAITPGSSSALEASHVLKASAGNLYSLYVTSTTIAGYLMTFNATSAPADGAVTPIECIYVPANATGSISNDGSPPDAYSTGIVTVFSTTGPFTKTGSATAFFKWRVQ